ncbi:uncharacterized protein LOC105422433 [Pogonomyrmex barbatus]|uniref:Uncharacterized protein LOC105422433 n=1 Tax=Pogonomyrmex barbatus TaxID=144034 RepID=A0A6I9VR86_9HYME|nr:uncharacterized protein LOC105422433 [Pogonomyrmex barbatus]
MPMFVHDDFRGPPPLARLLIGKVPVEVGPHIKYLGLTLDGQWGFRRHFDLLAPRVKAVANRLNRLLPNLGGPSAKVRRLYANTVHSVALYGSPIWVQHLAEDDKSLRQMRQAQRRIALRLAQAYRTVSHAAVAAGTPPIDLLAFGHAEVYRRVRQLRSQGAPLTNRAVERVRQEVRRRIVER